MIKRHPEPNHNVMRELKNGKERFRYFDTGGVMFDGPAYKGPFGPEGNKPDFKFIPMKIDTKKGIVELYLKNRIMIKKYHIPFKFRKLTGLKYFLYKTHSWFHYAVTKEITKEEFEKKIKRCN